MRLRANGSHLSISNGEFCNISIEYNKFIEGIFLKLIYMIRHRRKLLAEDSITTNVLRLHMSINSIPK